MTKKNTSVYVDGDLVERAEDDDDWDSLSQLVGHLLEEYYSGNTISGTGDGVRYATQDDLENMREELLSEIRAVEDLMLDDDATQANTNDSDDNDDDEVLEESTWMD